MKCSVLYLAWRQTYYTSHGDRHNWTKAVNISHVKFFESLRGTLEIIQSEGHLQFVSHKKLQRKFRNVIILKFCYLSRKAECSNKALNNLQQQLHFLRDYVSCRGHLVMSGEIFDCPNWDRLLLASRQQRTGMMLNIQYVKPWFLYVSHLEQFSSLPCCSHKKVSVSQQNLGSDLTTLSC